MKIPTKSLILLLALAAAPGLAAAGPQLTFGPNDENVLQIDYKAQFQLRAQDVGSGPNRDDWTTSLGFRRNRLAFLGKHADWMSLYVQTEYVERQDIGPVSVSQADAGQNFQLLDAVVRFDLSDWFKVNVGKFKYNFTRENLEACETPLTLDRSLFIRAPYVSTRDTGVALWGNLFADRFQYRLDAMQGRGATTAAAIQPKSIPRFSARAHVSLLDPENGYGYKGTYLGEKKVLTVGGAVQFEPSVAYADTVGNRGGKNYFGWTVDGFVEYPVAGLGTFTASGAFERVDIGDVYLGTNPDPDAVGLNGQKRGYFVKAGYLLPGFPLQLSGRYENWKFATLNGVFDQQLHWFAGSVNYYLRGQDLKLTVEGSRTRFIRGSGTVADGTKDFTTFVAQLQVMF